MDSNGLEAGLAADGRLRDVIAAALVDGALPGELAGFADEERQDAAAFLLDVAQGRRAGEPAVRLESLGGTLGQRRMRLGIVNDDMPFLVDSVAAAIGARGLTIHRLLHPVLGIDRDANGTVTGIDPDREERAGRESFMYLEIDRADARGRRELAEGIAGVLADVRAAVADWPKLQARMRADADALGDEEGAALMRWFADGAMTLLGHEVQCGPEGEAPLGILARPGLRLWSELACDAARRFFDEGGPAPLVIKADSLSTVHRRVPLDLVIAPAAGGALSVHAGLWTSQALATLPEHVPVVRSRLAELEQAFGFDTDGHAGKALRHAVSTLPRDLVAGLEPSAVEELVTTSMSLADRPRPTLVLVPSALRRQLFAFVWLPRDELNTRRREAIGAFIAEAAGGHIINWALELGEGDLALIRYMIDIPDGAAMPDKAALDRRLVDLVRGWAPAVEEALGTMVGSARAARLAISFIDDFPEAYRRETETAEAAADIVRISGLEGAGARDARLYAERGEATSRLRLKTYRLAGVIPLSEAVPALENFGFRVLEELPTQLDGGQLGSIHDFALEVAGGGDAAPVLARADLVEHAVAEVLEGRAENDAFNQLLVGAGLDRRGVVLFRAWFRYLRQTGISYGIATVVEALRRAPDVAQALIALFDAAHDPDLADRQAAEQAADAAIAAGLAKVAAIDDDRILRLFRGVIGATLRTNAFSPAAAEALAFKFDSAKVPGLPAPVPWREIWVYSPRVEGIHLRGGPVARGGLRWSDRRDDFRTEILGLMKAQVVKNAVIVPTGAKGGFYPKQLPPASDREAWLAEGTESYRIFIRSLLSVTDNIVNDAVVHPDRVAIRDGEDPYFVVAADKGTATFSDVANEIAVGRGFWLGDAFASGGSQGYDHKAMGITAKGAWVSVQRHFAEMGIDVQTQPISVAGCGDMSGDVFGNGMLLSKAIRLVAAFDHRHIFLDPNPDPARSWDERARLFALPRSSWDDYDKSLISAGGGVFPRSQKEIALSAEVQALLGLEAATIDPASLINAILKAEVDLIWFGGIGTYVKASSQNNAEVGDHANDAIRVSATELRARAIGEGANLGVTQAARIEFAARGGRINTDFIDNSAGVDCSDNEVNIKIPLNREVREGRLSEADRNALLAEMTDEVAALVLEDNRLQTLALSIAEQGGSAALPSLVRAIELLEESGRLNRAVEGLDSNDELLRRAQDGRGLTRPELAVLLSTSKMALQAAIEAGGLADDPTLEPDLIAAFPPQMQERHGEAIRTHRLRRQIIATKTANRFVNRLGITALFGMAEEEGASFAQVAAAFVAAERLFDMKSLWSQLDDAPFAESLRLALFDQASRGLQFHIADILRSAPAGGKLEDVVAAIEPGLRRMEAVTDRLLRQEARQQSEQQRARLLSLGAPEDVTGRIVRLFELDGAIGIANLAQRIGIDALVLTEAYTKLGEALGLDWAQNAANRFNPSDQWERLLTAGLARDFEQLRLDFLQRRQGADPVAAVDEWVAVQAPRISQFRRTVERARVAPVTSTAMLAQIATQARVLLAR